MAITRPLYNFARWEYSFVVCFAALVAITVGVIVAFFPHSLFRSGGPQIIATLAVLSIQPVAFLTGYCGAAKNVANPYDIEGGLPLWPIIAVVSLLGYVASTGALLFGQLSAGFGDPILLLVMLAGFAGFGWREYKRHWIRFDLESDT